MLLSRSPKLPSLSASCKVNADAAFPRGLPALLGLATALGVGLSLPAPASAVTLADNLGETTISGVAVDYTSPTVANWQGMKFNTTSASIINSVTVKLANGSAVNTGSVAFDIYTVDGGGLPGSKVASVGSILASSIATTDANYTLNSLSLALNPYSSYYLLASPVGFNSGTGITWRYTSTPNGFGYTPPVRARSGNNGSSFFFGPGTDYLQLKIEASADVPGPLPVLGGAAAFGWSRRLRLRLRAANKAAGCGSHGA